MKHKYKTPAGLLAAARRLLIKKGWCQGLLHDEDKGSFCALGAIYFCQHGSVDVPTVSSVEENAIRYLEKVVGDQDIEEHNDGHDRTKAQILGVFKRARRMALKDVA